MKLTDDMLFAHPVLSSDSNDYRDALFEAAFEFTPDDSNLDLNASIRLNCADLDALIKSGGAGCGFYLIAPQTYQNRLVEMMPGSKRHRFNSGDFFGTVRLRPVVWSKAPQVSWRSKYLHPEYSGVADFPAATVLAVGDEQRFSLDRERLKPFESIFSLASDDALMRGQIAVDPDNDKILILAHSETKESIDEIRNNSAGRSALLNAVYLPAVMQVLDEISKGAVGLENHPWYRIFSAKCGAVGVDPTKPELLRDAQRLLNFPFSRIEREKERLFA